MTRQELDNYPIYGIIYIAHQTCVNSRRYIGCTRLIVTLTNCRHFAKKMVRGVQFKLEERLKNLIEAH